ncbi:MAG: TolC family protein, partial [Bacteroidota bacterium]
AKIQTFGPTIGIGAQYNIFDGGVRKTRIQSAKKQVEINQLQKENLEDQLLSQAIKARNQLMILAQQIQREEQNLNTFEEAYMRIQGRYENGKASALDLRDAQLALLNVKLRIDQLKVDQMIALFELRKLRGRLVQ